jgi:hypothetical protein
MNERLFKPAVETLAAQLVDIGDSTSAMLADLARDPTPERCERAQAQLSDLHRYVGTLRQAAVAKAA